jgi:hypothetical protein
MACRHGGWTTISGVYVMSFMQFFLDNAIAIGIIAFSGMLYTIGSKTERILLIVAGSALLSFWLTGTIEIPFAILSLGAGLMLFDRIRAG